jgi:hypothetical protein
MESFRESKTLDEVATYARRYVGEIVSKIEAERIARERVDISDEL